MFIIELKEFVMTSIFKIGF